MDTSRLSAIDRHLAWSQDQLPMLRRRHSIAVDAAKLRADYGTGSGMVDAGADSLGAYKTQAEARKAAEDDAKAYEDGKLSPQDYYKKLQANQYDPDYCTAAADALGDTRLHTLQRESFSVDPDDPQAGMTILATFVSTAMRGGTTLTDDSGNEDIQLLAGLVPLAPFPKDVLVNLGTQCLISGNYPYGKYIWPALSANPAAATQFLHDHMDMLPQWMASDSDRHGGLPDDQAALFAEVIKAGTLGGPGADPNMAAANTTALISFYASHKGAHTHTEIDNAFAQDIQHYWGDLQPTLTDPEPSDDLGPGHVSVPPEEWRVFVDEAMRDPKAAAFLLAFSRQQATDLAHSDHHNPETLNASGVLKGFFDHEAKQVYADMGADGTAAGKKWQGTVTTWLNTGILTGVTVAFDPKAVAVPIARSTISETIKFFADDKLAVDGGEVPKPPQGTTWQDDWKESAADAYTDDRTVGDPGHYAKEYCGGHAFLTSEGTLVDGATAQQKQAYNAWLKDPAVAKALDDGFQQRETGRHSGLLGEN